MVGTRIVAALFILFGVALILFLIWLALQRMVFEAMAISLPAAIVFRAGVGLMRMATSAQLAMKLRQPVDVTSDRRR